MLAIFLITLGIFSRVVIHVPNFTPIIALSLFSGTYLNKKYAVLLPLVLMLVSDFIIGWHNTMFFTYGSIILITVLGFWLKGRKDFLTITALSIFSSVIFFVITNFGAWAVPGLYPPTAEGLQQCFIMAIPFFRATLLSSLLYSLIFFGLYEWTAVRVKNTKLARVLLTN